MAAATEPGATTAMAAAQRHPLLVRIAHWVNAAAFLVLAPSGALILWVHPELYWGETGYFGDPAWLRLGLEPNFHISPTARNYHFLAAWILVLNGVVYLTWGLLTRHFRRKLALRREEMTSRHLLADIGRHLRFRHARRRAAREYNTLQKLAYLTVIFVLLPIMLISGLTLSPGFTAAFPEIFWLWGRQTARSVHFLAACGLVGFLVIHIVQVFAVGFRREMRAMLTGRFTPPPGEETP